MINISPSTAGMLSVLYVSFEITNAQETNRVISQLNQIAKLNNITVNINLKTKSDASSGMSTKSLIKQPVIPDSSVSRILESADAAIPNLEWYRKSPVGKPFRRRIERSKHTMRQVVKEAYKKMERQRGVITSREEYMSKAGKSLKSVLTGNNIYNQWVNMITK